MAVGCWLCNEVPAVMTLPNGMHVCQSCAGEPDPTIHTWDGPNPPVVLRDDDGAPLRPCAGDWPEDEDAE